MARNWGWLSGELADLRQQGLVRNRRVCRPAGHGRIELDGVSLLDFSSNDSLNLAGDPRVTEAAALATRQFGSGARASALVSGRGPLHAELEQTLAEFEGTEAAILFPSGFAANLGLLNAVMSRGDLVCADRLNHASLIDGCRSSDATFRVYRHNELDRLARVLETTPARRKFIVSDGVFSMDGDLAPLSELCDLAERHDAAVLVDEAHGTGVYGEHGRGVSELQGVEDRVAARIGTLSKAIGAIGGFVSGSTDLIEWLWNRGRTQVFSTAIPPSACAAAIAALGIIRAEPARRHTLMQQSAQLRDDLLTQGWRLPDAVAGPIIPVIVGSAAAAVAASERLLQAGCFVPAIRPPTVPQNTARLRISLSCAHQDAEIHRLVTALQSLPSELRQNRPAV